MIAALLYESSDLLSIYSPGQLIWLHYYVERTTCFDPVGNVDFFLIHESQDLAYVGQHDHRINALNKGNT